MRPERGGDPRREAELAQERPAAPEGHAALAGEQGDFPAHVLDFLLGDGDADAIPEEFHLGADPDDGGPRRGLVPGEG
eukprot:6968519-Alexandrium_andersonii.AAC.1